MNMLPGWHPGSFTGGADPGTITFVNSSTSITNTITAPADIQAGDLLIIIETGSDNDGSPPADVTPSGFTLVNTEADNDGSKFSWRTSMYYKLATGAEASGSFSVIDGNDPSNTPNQRSTFLVFRRSAAAISISPLGSVTASDTDTTIVSNVGVVPLVVIGANMMNEDTSGDGGDIANFVLDPAGDGVVANGADNDVMLLVTRWKIYNRGSAPANVTMDVQTTPSWTINGAYFQMAA